MIIIPHFLMCSYNFPSLKNIISYNSELGDNNTHTTTNLEVHIHVFGTGPLVGLTRF